MFELIRIGIRGHIFVKDPNLKLDRNKYIQREVHLFCAEVETDMTKLTVVYRNYVANAPTKNHKNNWMRVRGLD